MTETFDLVVIGTGAAASPVARRCRAAGWNVAIVDRRAYGGTCALRGCEPKKVLVEVARAVDEARRLQGKGVEGRVSVQWPELMQFKRSFTEPVPEKKRSTLEKSGIATFRGQARFVEPTTLQVGDDLVKARHVHIATGAKPAELPIAGTEHMTTSDEFLELDELPRRVLFLGTGYISFELAHVARIAGANVTMLEMTDRALAGFEPEIVDLLVERTRRMDASIHLSTKVERIEQQPGGLLVRATSGGEERTFEADLVVHGGGRVPNLDDLDLEAAEVERDDEGVLVNAYMQSVSNPSVYAAGDAAKGGLPLTPVAALEADVAAANLLEGNRHQIEYPAIPSVVFTTPPLASVGLTKEEAKARGAELETKHARTSGWYSTRRAGEELGGYRILIEKGTRKILGAHLLGPEADGMINLFAMAMQADLSIEDLQRMMFAYPTIGSDLKYMLG